MRRRFFRIILNWLQARPPGFFARLELMLLRCITAGAFCKKPEGRLFFCTYDMALQDYRTFTVRCMKTGGDPARLYGKAYRAGALLRLVTGFRDPEDISSLIFFLYRNIGISMSGRLPEQIEVSGCFFSSAYTPRMCALMSWMDSGIVGGMFSGGRLRFTCRLTQGCGMCRAYLERHDNTHCPEKCVC